METVGEISFYDTGVKVPTLRQAQGKLSRAKDAREMGHPVLLPWAELIARVKLADAALLLPGDRFIIRQFSPVVTIGGGVVLDAAPMLGPREVRKIERAAGASIAAFSQTMEGLGWFERHGAILALRVTRRGKRGITLAEAVAETGWPRLEIEKTMREVIESGIVVRFQERMFAEGEFELAQAGVLDAVSSFHGRNPLSAGMPKGEMQDELQRALDMAPELFEATLARLVKDKKLELVSELVRLPGRGVVMKDEEAESKQRIEEAFATAGLKVPALHEVMAGLKIDKTRAQKIVTLLLRDRALVKVSDELVFHRGALEQLRRDLTGYKMKSAKIDVAQFKELTGVSRKYAIPLLEYLDRERVTRRVGDVREIL
jgi:selenocysteine-specific elongation factor